MKKKTAQELIENLKQVRAMGFVETHRRGNTGVGKTSEDLLGVEENNFPGPNGHMTELKSGRKQSTSNLTMFTKAPLPRGINSKLRDGYGYWAKGNKKSLNITLSAVKFNTIKGKPGFKVNISRERVEIIHSEPYRSIDVPYWDKDILKSAFDKKYQKLLLYVKADVKWRGNKEHFHYNEAYLLSGFSFSRFVNLLQAGDILVDIRIGHCPNGRSHDRGTGFRIHPNKLDMCFASRNAVL